MKSDTRKASGDLSHDTEGVKGLHYDHKTVEEKWLSTWHDNQIDTTDIGLTGVGKGKKPFYNLMMFPYPSAEGLHVGNMYAFTGSDILGRFKRMQGYEVFEPIGLDGFGIHSENYALKIGRHPMDHAAITEKNFYNQLHRIGAMYDWTRTVETYDPDYYCWTQWLFVQMFKHGLAYRGKAQVNWCPSCKTVLADEQVLQKSQIPNPNDQFNQKHTNQADEKGVIISVCERCGSTVKKRLLEQWFFRITAYAEQLLQNTFSLNWSEKVLIAQRNWIGKNKGLAINFPVDGLDEPITVWTKYWETVYGTTFLALAPEYGVIGKMKIPKEYQKDIEIYIKDALKRREKKQEVKDKTGVFTGVYATSPVNGERVPIWIADYVLTDIGTGAVMGVPAHDERDFAFVKKYGLPIIQVVRYKDTEIDSKVSKFEMSHEGEGALVHSGQFDGLDAWGEGKEKMAAWMIEKKFAKWQLTYHLRDWLISRQRYWGPPIPMIFCSACAKEGKGQQSGMPGWFTVAENQLPVILPRIEDYKPGNDGVAPLAKHKEFYETTCPGCGSKAVRETDVSDTFLDSSWYFLRYPSTRCARSGQVPFDPEVTKKWLPVSVYTGGAEHSVLHLMYSRFVAMALHDWKFISFDEPFPNFFAHGLIIKDGAKMSKSRGNVVNMDEYIDRYGADALRLYLMFTGPFSQGGDFRDSAMEGAYRWINRVWRLTQTTVNCQLSTVNPEIERALHKLVKKVGEDIEARRYNTAIAAMMEFTNLVADQARLPARQARLPARQGGTLPIELLKTFLLILAPFAPFITEELWQQAVHSSQWTVDSSIHKQPWPSFDPSALVDDTVEIVIQVNGKVRDKLVIDRKTASDKEKLIVLAKKSDKVLKYLDGKEIVRTIIVPGRLVNFVM